MHSIPFIGTVNAQVVNISNKINTMVADALSMKYLYTEISQASFAVNESVWIHLQQKFAKIAPFIDFCLE